MNKKQAINILIKQREKLFNDSVRKDETWVFQTASYIKDFFGESSMEFTFISQFKFHVIFSNRDSQEDINRWLREKPVIAKQFLDDCIETLNIKGLYKPESKFKKWRSEPENWWKILVFIVSIIVTIGGIIVSALVAMKKISL